ncbi:DUF4393 domain-containing protein [Skermania sp. ID1734]|uniref:Abi-alpha family protein n=1 Tax=Skermania sp. ID1734 TaxID=2597516 RepID=UPI001180F9FE|nr:Abi-alpha family protein [Skermania sp. ID1734]TSD99748.1 DUF4393 domain-containing protein [Skermania sp. ID1734]
MVDPDKRSDADEDMPSPSRFDILRAAPRLASVAATSVRDFASWSFDTTVDASTFVWRRSLAGVPPRDILAEGSSELRKGLRRLLGVSDPIQPARSGSSSGDEVLKARGAALLRRAADVHVSDDEGHPAYARILAELAPDEARILRFLYLDGPQPSIDIRTGRPLGIGSQLVEGGLNMIGEHAGLLRPNKIHPYLTNLNRLGLVEFSKEQVADPTRYQLVEAQPHMQETLKKAGFAAKAIPRSILLTSFGRDFVEACLPITEGHFHPGYAHRDSPKDDTKDPTGQRNRRREVQ